MGGWNRMRAGRRLRAWQKAGQIRRNAEEIIVTTPVTPTVTETPRATVTRGSNVGPVRYLAELIGTPATDLERPKWAGRNGFGHREMLLLEFGRQDRMEVSAG
jgi:hypothetical protein